VKPTNVIILKSDEHNPFYSSVHGHPYIQTPNMQRLASEGVVFENAYCPSPLCAPSRSSFVSGRRVHEIRTYNNCNVFRFDYPSYGEVLRRQGIHTVLAGKSDVYREPSELGFSEILVSRDRKPPGDKNMSRNPLAIRHGADARADGFGVRKDPFEADESRVQEALRWLAAQAPKLDHPWVMDLNLSKPHFPQYVTQLLWDRYPQGADLPVHGGECESANHPYALDLRAHFQTDAFGEPQVRGLRRGYLGCITFVDRQLGRLLEALKASDLSDSTVVAYTSDHGEMLGKFGMWWKCSLYEDSVRVPLIVSGPGFDRGARVETPVDLLDLQATLFRVTGSERPCDWSGVPLQDIQKRDTHRTVFSEYHGHGTRGSSYMIRKGRWKLIHYCHAPHQLFDLGSDTQELVNVFEDHPDVARELTRDLRGICSPEQEDLKAEQFVQRQLRAVGGVLS
jgi:choline-sulfatase